MRIRAEGTAREGNVRRVFITQLTDTHITQDGVQARYLTQAIAWINALDPQPAAVVLSGDTVNDGRPEQYAILRDILAGLRAAVYVVPGNHDRRAALRAVLPDTYYPGVRGERLHFAVDTGPVRLIGLDTSEGGRPGGFLNVESLAWLEAALIAAPDRPVFAFMHHPPFRTGVHAADWLGFKGVDRFRDIVGRHRAVRRIVAGHIHCERRADIAQATATTCISSAPQHVPEVFERRLIGLRFEAPGLALHTWRGDGFESTTHVNGGDGRFAERAAGGIDPSPRARAGK
jgi:3',5'-cyclic AMP phosphodiesterase CpdA